MSAATASCPAEARTRFLDVPLRARSPEQTESPLREGYAFTDAEAMRRTPDENVDDTHRFHDLRDTFATRMAAAGVPMRTLQE